MTTTNSLSLSTQNTNTADEPPPCRMLAHVRPLHLTFVHSHGFISRKQSSCKECGGWDQPKAVPGSSTSSLKSQKTLVVYMETTVTRPRPVLRWTPGAEEAPPPLTSDLEVCFLMNDGWNHNLFKNFFFFKSSNYLIVENLRQNIAFFQSLQFKIWFCVKIVISCWDITILQELFVLKFQIKIIIKIKKQVRKTLWFVGIWNSLSEKYLANFMILNQKLDFGKLKFFEISDFLFTTRLQYCDFTREF